jgi:hypothetical protein
MRRATEFGRGPTDHFARDDELLEDLEHHHNDARVPRVERLPPPPPQPVRGPEVHASGHERKRGRECWRGRTGEEGRRRAGGFGSGV